MGQYHEKSRPNIVDDKEIGVDQAIKSIYTYINPQYTYKEIVQCSIIHYHKSTSGHEPNSANYFPRLQEVITNKRSSNMCNTFISTSNLEYYYNVLKLTHQFRAARAQRRGRVRLKARARERELRVMRENIVNLYLGKSENLA